MRTNLLTFVALSDNEKRVALIVSHAVGGGGRDRTIVWSKEIFLGDERVGGRPSGCCSREAGRQPAIFKYQTTLARGRRPSRSG